MKENFAKTAAALTGLQEIIEKLVGPDGCSWDQAQTSETLCEYLLEEAYELVDAVRNRSTADVREELGDLLFSLTFMANIFERKGEFSFGDSISEATEKMIRRHPHVFGTESVSNNDEILQNWEKIKRAEKAKKEESNAEKSGPAKTFSSLPEGLPSLMKAYRIHSKAARLNFTWDSDDDAEQQFEAEWLELIDVMRGEGETKTEDKAEALENEFGDMLFTLVELGRRKGIKANAALDKTNSKFLARFARMEVLAHERGFDFVELSLEDKDALWNEAKAEEKTKKSDAESAE